MSKAILAVIASKLLLFCVLFCLYFFSVPLAQGARLGLSDDQQNPNTVSPFQTTRASSDTTPYHDSGDYWSKMISDYQFIRLLHRYYNDTGNPFLTYLKNDERIRKQLQDVFAYSEHLRFECDLLAIDSSQQGTTKNVGAGRPASKKCIGYQESLRILEMALLLNVLLSLARVQLKLENQLSISSNERVLWNYLQGSQEFSFLLQEIKSFKNLRKGPKSTQISSVYSTKMSGSAQTGTKSLFSRIWSGLKRCALFIVSVI